MAAECCDECGEPTSSSIPFAGDDPARDIGCSGGDDNDEARSREGILGKEARCVADRGGGSCCMMLGDDRRSIKSPLLTVFVATLGDAVPPLAFLFFGGVEEGDAGFITITFELVEGENDRGHAPVCL